MSREQRNYIPSQEELLIRKLERKILREVSSEAFNPLYDRVRVILSDSKGIIKEGPRQGIRRKLNVKRTVVLVDFIGDGSFHEVKINPDGRFNAHFKNGIYYPGSDTFAMELLGEGLASDIDPETLLVEHILYNY